eukprot:Skav218089  [mRNA]  locus=scaffold1801:65685:66329:- [translate_table: standard]
MTLRTSSEPFPRSGEEPESSLKSVHSKVHTGSSQKKVLKTAFEKNKHWRCPVCPFQVQVQRGASKDIFGHLYKCHGRLVQQTLAENRELGIQKSGLGMRDILKPVIFTKIKKKDRKTADFICPCGFGMKSQPSSPFLRAKSKRFHLRTCEAVKGPMDLRAYQAMARECTPKLQSNRRSK